MFSLSSASINVLLVFLVLLYAVVLINSYRMNKLLKNRYPDTPNFLGWAGMTRYLKWATRNNNQPLLSQEMKDKIKSDPELHRMNIVHRIVIVSMVAIAVIVIINWYL